MTGSILHRCIVTAALAIAGSGYAVIGSSAAEAAEETGKPKPAPNARQASVSRSKAHKKSSAAHHKENEVGVSGKWYASPNGRFVLVHIERWESGQFEMLPSDTGHNDGFAYVLDRETVTAVELPPYGRDAAFLWSPDGTRLVYNDYAGSSETYCYIYEFVVESGKLIARKTDLQELLKSVSDVAPMFTAIHQYVVGKEWVDARTLILDIEAQPTDDNKWCNWRYSFAIDGHFKKLKYHESSMDISGK